MQWEKQPWPLICAYRPIQFNGWKLGRTLGFVWINADTGVMKTAVHMVSRSPPPLKAVWILLFLYPLTECCHPVMPQMHTQNECVLFP